MDGARPDLLVVGGGVIGLAVAWRCARDGARVTLVERGGERGASWAAAGMLAPVTEAAFGEEPLARLGLAAVTAYPAFIADVEADAGRPAGLRTEGTLLVALDADDRAALARLTAFRQSLGLAAEVLPATAARRLEPLLSPRVSGGVLADGDLSVDPRRLVRALRAAASAREVHQVTGTAVELLDGGGRVTGVRLADGSELSADAVVLAAGSWSAGLPGIPAGVRVPVRPVKGQVLRLRASERTRLLAPTPTRTVRGLVGGRDIYLVPRADGEVVLGATSEERGFDETVTAGGVHELLRDAVELVPAVAELELVQAGAGLRPATPDNAPLVGLTAVPGLLLATGHHRNGVLLCGVTADAVADALAGRPVAPEWHAFPTDRFREAA